MNIYLSHIIITVLIFTGQIFSKTELTDSKKDSVQIIAIDVRKISEDSSTSVTITYPQILGLENTNIENKINIFLKDEFNQSIIWFDEFVAALDSFTITEYEAGMFFSFETGFDIKLNSGKILSLMLNHYQFTGSAHGNYFATGFTFDLSSGELITLENIIKPNKLLELTEITAETILEIYNSDSLSEAGLFEDFLELEWDQDFFLLENSIILQFDPYEIAPYSAGDIEVEIDYERINHLLKPTFKNLFQF